MAAGVEFKATFSRPTVASSGSQWPAGRSLQFELHGSTIASLQLTGYPEPKASADIGQFMLDLHSAISSRWKLTARGLDGPLPAARILQNGIFNFQPAALKTQRGQATTAWDETLPFYKVLLWDPVLLFSTEHPRQCPHCHGKLESNGLCTTARLFKGLGGVDPDTYVLTRRWKCTSTSHPPDQPKNFQDTDPDMRSLLPDHVQHRYPFVYQSPNTGLTAAAARSYASMAASGVSNNHLTSSINDMRIRTYADALMEHAERSKYSSTPQLLGPARPQVGPFPSRDLLGVKHNAAYTGEALDYMHAPLVEYSDRLMATYGGEVLSLDAGIKNAAKVQEGGSRVCTAVHTVLNSEKQVIAQYCGSNSGKELLPGLMALRCRFEELDQT